MPGCSRVLRVLCFLLALAAPAAAGETVPSAIRLAALTPAPSAARDAAQSEPLAARFAPHPQSQIARKWRDAIDAMARDIALLRACREQPDTCMLSAADTFLSISDAAMQRTGRARIGEINRAVNLAVRPADDAARFGLPDRWTSPLQTLDDARGDCEDYAIAKYALLREAGFAGADLRLVIVRLPRARVDHAVAAVRFEGRWLILDNRRMAMLDAEHYAGEALFVLRGEQQAGKPAMQADAGADFGAMPLVL